MASGLPDYLRGIDIAAQALNEIVVRPQNIPQTDVDVTAQTLGQLINRPKYGGGQITGGSATVTASDTTELISISGKGMIYGGSFRLDYTSTQASGVPELEIDGELVAALSFNGLDKYNFDKPRSSVIHLLKYDDTAFVYSVGVSYGITFESTLKLLYKENDGTTPLVSARVVYALV